MDKTLKELKRAREETEERFRGLLSRIEGDQAELRKACSEARALLAAERRRATRDLLEGIVGMVDSIQESIQRLSAGLREMAALDNARCAELARQLTVLPFERTDLLFDQFERRLETLESRLGRLEKKTE